MRNVTGCPTAMSAVAAASTTKHAIRRAAAFASNPPMSSPGSPKRERSTWQQSVSARSFAANTFFGAGKAAEQPPLRRDGGTAWTNARSRWPPRGRALGLESAALRWPLGEWRQKWRRRNGVSSNLTRHEPLEARQQPPRSGLLEKRQCAEFDALARPRIGRRGRVLESGVGGPAGAAVLRRVVDFEYQRLLAPHARQPVPAVLGIVGDGVGLADPVGIAALAHHEIPRRDAARVADREREALDRMADRPPHLHDGEAALQQFLRFVRKQVAHALRARPLGVIVVHAAHHLADLAHLALIGIGRAQGVIEYDHTRGAAFGLHQRLHLRVVDAADFALVEEIGNLGVVTNETEALAIERKRLHVQPRIADGHAVGIERAAAAYVGRARRRGLREYLLAVIENVVDGGLDGLADRFPLDDLNHGQLPRLRAAFPSRHPSAAAGRTPDISPRRGGHNRHTIEGALACRRGKPDIGKQRLDRNIAA